MNKTSIKTYKNGNFIWKYNTSESLTPDFFQKENISFNVAHILYKRGINTEEKLYHFRYDTLSNLANPFLMKDMHAAVERIIKAINQQESIVIYGDYDVDGITSTSILYRFLKKEGASVDFYIPNREKEGYGLNQQAIEQLAVQGTQLLITVDNGIAASDLIASAPKSMDFIITDHHMVPDKIPDAVAVINPHQEDCSYPYEDLAGCGVAFSVCRALSLAMHKQDYVDDVELVAMGTIADVVSLTGENRIFVKEGLKRLQSTSIVGIRALLEAAGIVKPDEDKKISVEDISFGVAPRLNASGRIAHAKLGVELMIASTMTEATSIAKSLCDVNIKRQAIEREIYKEALARLHELQLESSSVMVIDGHNWNSGVIGISASRILEQYNRPVLMITIKDGIGKGSCRSTPNFDIYQALKVHENLLIQLGGHKMAAGFSIQEENIPLFREAINLYAQKNFKEEDFVPELEIEQIMPLSEMTTEFIKELEILEPCGCDNPRPLFASEGLSVLETKHIGKDNKHFKCLLEQDSSFVQGIFWNIGIDSPCKIGDSISIVYRPEIHEWRGEHVQLICRDIALNKEQVSLNRDKLVKFYLGIKNKLKIGINSVTFTELEVINIFDTDFSRKEMQLMFCVFEEIGLIRKEAYKKETYYTYIPSTKKLDLTVSPTFCKYSFRE